MKKTFVFFFVMQFVFLLSQGVEKEVKVFKKVISAYIENTESYRKTELNKKENKNEEILIAYWMKVPDSPAQIIGVSFFNPAFLNNIIYSQIFDYEGYKLVLISKDIENFEEKFGKYFKKRKYEEINGNKYPETNFTPRNIGVEFNDKLEIVYFNPNIEGLLKNLLENKLIIAKDCSCLTHETSFNSK